MHFPSEGNNRGGGGRGGREKEGGEGDGDAVKHKDARGDGVKNTLRRAQNTRAHIDAETHDDVYHAETTLLIETTLLRIIEAARRCLHLLKDTLPQAYPTP